MGTVHSCRVCGETYRLVYCPNDFTQARILSPLATGEMVLLLRHSLTHKNDPSEESPPWCFPEETEIFHP